MAFVQHSARHALAIVLTALTISAIPAAVVVFVGVLGIILGIALTIFMSLGADPPLFGFIFGAFLTLVIILATVAGLILILATAHLFSGVIIMPATLFIRFVFDHWRICSRLAAIATHFIVGIVIGIGLALATWALAVRAQWQIGENPWFLVGAYTFWSLVTVAAMLVYERVLFAADRIKNVVETRSNKKKVIPVQ